MLRHIVVEREFNFESDVESHINADELSELSDYFDDDDSDKQRPATSHNNSNSISLDEISYSRDLNMINVPSFLKSKPTVLSKTNTSKQKTRGRHDNGGVDADFPPRNQAADSRRPKDKQILQSDKPSRKERAKKEDIQKREEDRDYQRSARPVSPGDESPVNENNESQFKGKQGKYTTNDKERKGRNNREYENSEGFDHNHEDQRGNKKKDKRDRKHGEESFNQGRLNRNDRRRKEDDFDDGGLPGDRYVPLPVAPTIAANIPIQPGLPPHGNNLLSNKGGFRGQMTMSRDNELDRSEFGGRGGGGRGGGEGGRERSGGRMTNGRQGRGPAMRGRGSQAGGRGTLNVFAPPRHSNNLYPPEAAYDDYGYYQEDGTYYSYSGDYDYHNQDHGYYNEDVMQSGYDGYHNQVRGVGLPTEYIPGDYFPVDEYSPRHSQVAYQQTHARYQYSKKPYGDNSRYPVPEHESNRSGRVHEKGPGADRPFTPPMMEYTPKRIVTPAQVEADLAAVAALNPDAHEFVPTFSFR